MDKELEKAHLQNFIQAYEGFPAGEIVPGESPDFLIGSPSQKIGIEHTRIFQPGPSHGGSLQAQERLRVRILEKANSIYSKIGSKAASAAVIFMPDHELKKHEIDSVALQLAELVASQEAVTPARGSMELKAPLFELPKCVATVYVFSSHGHSGSHFTHVPMGWVPEISSADIYNLIQDKESNIEKYRSQCQEVWLLMVADEMAPSSTFDLSEEARNHHYQTEFDRLFLLWNFVPEYTELKTAEAKENL